MGIIIASFPGIGRTYFTNLYNDKAKIVDFTKDEDFETLVDRLLGVVDNNDVLFVGANSNFRNALNERNVDYDIFYPTKERRGEFIENYVRKRANPNRIREVDKIFNSLVDEIENEESANCFKHKLEAQGDFLSNNSILMSYISQIGTKEKENEQN